MKKFDSKGFGAIEALVIVVVIVLLGAGGWLVYNHHKTTTTKVTSSAQSTSTTQKANAYAGWKTATLQYEKISYKYPANWTIADTSKATTKDKDCVYPGYDEVVLTSPSNNQVLLHTGVDCIGDAGAKAFGTVPVQSLGQSMYLAIENSIGAGDDAPTAPAFACLAQTATPQSIFAGASKNVYFSGNGTSSVPENRFCYYPYDQNAITTVPTTSVGALESSADFSAAKLIFESMQYN